MLPFGWLGVVIAAGGVWRCGGGPGAQCVMMDGIWRMRIGQSEPYGQGTGPIHMDELNCTGKERTLWDCPAVTNGHDCGHKEDAGVVCSG
ncbi:hypothetical protein M9458_037790, partial [Cirrhinus mrigala]